MARLDVHKPRFNPPFSTSANSFALDHSKAVLLLHFFFVCLFFLCLSCCRQSALLLSFHVIKPLTGALDWPSFVIVVFPGCLKNLICSSWFWPFIGKFIYVLLCWRQCFFSTFMIRILYVPDIGRMTRGLYSVTHVRPYVCSCVRASVQFVYKL